MCYSLVALVSDFVTTRNLVGTAIGTGQGESNKFGDDPVAISEVIDATRMTLSSDTHDGVTRQTLIDRVLDLAIRITNYHHIGVFAIILEQTKHDVSP
jgi:hypothetical protein